MAEEHNITLNCCGVNHKIIVNELALDAELDEARKNIICHNCDRLIVLSFRRRGNITIIDQEVV